MLSRGRQNMCIRLWHVPKLSRKLDGEWNFVLLSYGRDENHIGITQLWFNYLAASLYKALSVKLFQGG